MAILLTIVLIILFASAVAIIIIDPQPKKQTDGRTSYKYRYQWHSFDEWHFFFVKAESQEAANKRAIEIFTEMFEAGETIETVFYPVKQQ